MKENEITMGTYRIPRNARYSSPTLSQSTPRFLVPGSAMNALSANSNSVMSLVSCSLPISPSGFAIDACRRNVRMTYFAVVVTLSVHTSA